MTWKLTVRSNPGSTVRADYECPVHGRFTLDVVRDESSDPPAMVRCEQRLTDVESAELFASCHQSGSKCEASSPWRPSPPGVARVKVGEVVRGKSEARPADKHVMDTSLLADGMPYDQWKERRASVHRDESLRRVRKAFGYGPRTWVGGRR